MLYLMLSIVCSVSVGVIFKISRNYNCNNIQIIAVNYLIALLLSFFAFAPNLNLIDASAPFVLYGSLGILLPIVFLFLIASIANIGIVKTDAAQRLSLIIPILASWLIFNEEFTAIKIAGIIVGFFALFCILSKPSLSTNINWKFPTIVFFGFGIIDILFKKIAVYTVIPYTTSLFIIFAIAFIVILIPIVYQFVVSKKLFELKTVFFGFLVGVFNFGNILLYLKAHKSFETNPSTVFAGMNMGVIILGSVIGIVAFKEKLSKLNYLGLVLALISILIIVYAQFS